MSDVTDVEIGKLIEKVDALERTIRENSARLYVMEKELTRAKSMGVGVILATVGLSGIGGSLLGRWLNG